jgi:hypothetical protein
MRARVLIAAVAVLALVWLAWWWTRGAEQREPVAAADLAAPTTTPEVEAPLAEPAREPERLALAPSETPATSASPATKRVRLVDDQTGEPVPHFEAMVGYFDMFFPVESDAEGRFEVGGKRLSASAVLELSENTREAPDRIQTRREPYAAIPTSVALDVASGSDLPIPVGPTYQISTAVPKGYELEELIATLRSADPTQMFDVASARVRAGSPPWIRFRPTARILQGGPSWRLMLETPDSLYQASAIVAQNVGIVPGVVELSFEPRARLDGVVRNEQGDVLTNGLVRIERDGASFSDAANRPLFGRIDESGRYSVRGAPPGDYKVLHQRETFVPFEERVSLAPGEVRELDITMRKLDASQLARITGRVESTSGAFEERLYVALLPSNDKQSPRNGRVEWSDEAGRKVGSFEFEEVPLGRYVVRINGQRFREVEPESVELAAGDPELRFTVHDDARTTPVAFGAIDEHGATLPRFLAELRLPSGTSELFDRVTTTTGSASFRGVPIGSRCRYKVSAPDRKPVWGEIDIVESANELTVTLAPGWGIEVYAVDESGGPLDGARVYFDDVLAGTTNAKGVLRVALDRTPELARVEFRDWIRAESSRLEASGRFRTFEPWLNAVLKPPPR